MLTKRQNQIYEFINEYSQKYGISPTHKEIGNKFKLSSVATVHEHLSALKEKGYIKKEHGQNRAIEIKKTKNENLVHIPIIGTIAAGQPIEAVEHHQGSVSVVNSRIKNSKDYYALNVIGSSMIDEGIFDGDIVVIKKQSVAENGQTVVALIDEGKATLKKLYKEKNRFRLEPRNQNMLPFFRKEVEVQGVVIQIIRNINEEKKAGLKTIDLFAGVGGIRTGFERAGFKTVFANDFEPQCKDTYDLNFKDSKLVVEDIRKIGIDDLPEFDFLLGGFPCQPFSIAGYREGFKDQKNRGNLFFDIVRIIDARKPAGFLLENVKNLKSHDGGNTFRVIIETLEKLGYHIKTKVLNSMEYGNIPQNRERVYIVGFRNKDYHENFNFPAPVKLTMKITDLLEKNVPEKYYYNGKPLFARLKDFVKKEGVVYQWRRQYVRENKKGVCPTLTANMGTGGHNVPIIKDGKGIRKLTPLECARIQGFPKDYKLPQIADSALYKQFGNSVSVPVVEAVARQIVKAISAN